MVKYPEISIQLVGEDGNAFSILARVNQALRRAGVDSAEREAFMAEAQSGDYGNLLRTVMAWVTTDPDDDDEEAWYDLHPNGCYDCKEKYAVGGCPSCGDEGGY